MIGGEQIISSMCTYLTPNFLTFSFFLVYEWCRHEAVLNLAIPCVWERIGRFVNKQWQVPKAVIHVDANLCPDDINLHGANPSKVMFLFTGSEVQ